MNLAHYFLDHNLATRPDKVRELEGLWNRQMDEAKRLALTDPPPAEAAPKKGKRKQFKKREKKNIPVGIVHIAASFNNTLISITDIFRLVHLDFPQFKYSLAWYLIASFTVVTTVLFGRLYCGRICAFGSLTQLLDAVVPKRLRWEPPADAERYAGYVKYVLLVAVVGAIMLFYVVLGAVMLVFAAVVLSRRSPAE